MYTVSSEIYSETNYQPTRTEDGQKVVSKFRFRYPETGEKQDKSLSNIIDKDGDLDVARPRRGVIELEHSVATELKLVGLQVWRGALLLADYLFHRRESMAGRTIMELGAGVGLTSIAAAIHNAGQVYCTDVDLGCILQLISGNVQRNLKLLHGQGQGQVKVMEFNFLTPKEEQTEQLLRAIDASDIILAADVIYDDTLTDAFIRVIDEMLKKDNKKTFYVALEKRYVFTFADCDSVAPMYEYFVAQTRSKPWLIEHLPLDFPQYFEYERCPQLVLMRITSR
ncbi:uncharacterized protein Dwil_GK13435 [Drosophila willistoni]|uniref:Methyltransferase-like protein 22 n=1 Tax=Drosophila willistoni TaxID=7260 RepID=B4N3V3_DROWI|nr:methyltransferase-like protein 22 [Drosophila willistoni]EDW79308.1 uncharacterized protein Dwil_GK13435 [Drosophila willistoni]